MTKESDYDIAWSRRPAEGIVEPLWRIIRPPTKGIRRVGILSHDITGCYTHYYAGRTVPCRREACPACATRLLPTWHGYLAVIESGSGHRLILELTARAIKPIDDCFRDRRTLAGTIIEVGRTSAKANGQQWTKVIPGTAEFGARAKAPNVIDVLTTMWRIKPHELFAPLVLAEPTNVEDVKTSSNHAKSG